MLDERKAGQPARRFARRGVVEQQNRTAPIGLEEDVPDEPVRPEFGDPASFRLQVRGDVLAGEVPDGENLHRSALLT
jgi:hypothetical protein